MAVSSFRSILTILLLWCAIASARSHKNNNGDQEIVFSPADISPSTLTVQGEADVRYVAEVANLDISIRAYAASDQDATEMVQSSLQNVEELFTTTQIEKGETSESAAELFNSSWVSRPSRNRRWKDSEDEDEHYAQVQVSARFRSIPQLRRFMKNVSQDSLVEVDWINWELSEATLTKAKAAVRRKVVKDAIQNAKIWAEAIGQGSMKIEGLVDEGTWNNVESKRGWRDEMRMSDTDFEVPEMTVHQSIKCTFRL